MSAISHKLSAICANVDSDEDATNRYWTLTLYHLSVFTQFISFTLYHIHISLHGLENRGTSERNNLVLS